MLVVSSEAENVPACLPLKTLDESSQLPHRCFQPHYTGRCVEWHYLGRLYLVDVCGGLGPTDVGIVRVPLIESPDCRVVGHFCAGGRGPRTAVLSLSLGLEPKMLSLIA